MHSSFSSCSFSAAGAGRRTCERHGLTLNISSFFFCGFLLFPSLPLGAQSWFEASQEIRPHRIVHLRPALAFTQHFGVSLLRAPVTHSLSIDLSASLSGKMRHFLHLFSFGARGCMWRAARSSAAGSGNFTDARKAHVPTESIFLIFFVLKAKYEMK